MVQIVRVADLELDTGCVKLRAFLFNSECMCIVNFYWGTLTQIKQGSLENVPRDSAPAPSCKPQALIDFIGLCILVRVTFQAGRERACIVDGGLVDSIDHKKVGPSHNFCFKTRNPPKT